MVRVGTFDELQKTKTVSPDSQFSPNAIVIDTEYKKLRSVINHRQQQDGNPYNGPSAIMVKVKLLGQDGPIGQNGQDG